MEPLHCPLHEEHSHGWSGGELVPLSSVGPLRGGIWCGGVLVRSWCRVVAGVEVTNSIIYFSHFLYLN